MVYSPSFQLGRKFYSLAKLDGRQKLYLKLGLFKIFGMVADGRGLL